MSARRLSVRKAVIPAAGFGTRFLPATKAVPKEMVPVVDKPMIQYAVEEAIGSGIGSIGLVTSRWKTSISEHFGHSPELERFLAGKGRTGLLAELAAIGRPAEFAVIDQPEQRGLGHAVLMAETFAAGEPVAVLNPDTIYDCPVPCLRQLLDVFEAKGASVVVLGRISPEATRRHAVVRARPVADRVFKLLDMIEKPGTDAAPSDLAILGRYVLTPGIFDAIRATAPGTGGEIQITDAIKILSASEPVFGVLFEGKRYDAGDKFGYLEATVNLALKRPEFGDRLRELLKTLI
jgi:UTP--glucose-1-phosphate uridylyltransferase